PDDRARCGGEDRLAYRRGQGAAGHAAEAAAGGAGWTVARVLTSKLGEFLSFLGELGKQLPGNILRGDDNLPQLGLGVALAVSGEVIRQARLGDVVLELVDKRFPFQAGLEISQAQPFLSEPAIRGLCRCQTVAIAEAVGGLLQLAVGN